MPTPAPVSTAFPATITPVGGDEYRVTLEPTPSPVEDPVSAPDDAPVVATPAPSALGTTPDNEDCNEIVDAYGQVKRPAGGSGYV